MKTKDEIVANWLPRYTGTPLKIKTRKELLETIRPDHRHFLRVHERTLQLRAEIRQVRFEGGDGVFEFLELGDAAAFFFFGALPTFALLKERAVPQPTALRESGLRASLARLAQALGPVFASGRDGREPLIDGIAYLAAAVRALRMMLATVSDGLAPTASHLSAFSRSIR